MTTPSESGEDVTDLLSHQCPWMVKYATLGYVRIVESRNNRSPRAAPSAAVMKYVAVFDEYGLPIPDGGSSHLIITFCPWCGAKLPPSQRDRWFEKLDELGLEPDSEQIPPEMQDSSWWRDSAR